MGFHNKTFTTKEIRDEVMAIKEGIVSAINKLLTDRNIGNIQVSSSLDYQFEITRNQAPLLYWNIKAEVFKKNGEVKPVDNRLFTITKGDELQYQEVADYCIDRLIYHWLKRRQQ